jgi:geranylgeranyl diphosphate synthase, type II
MSNSSSPIEEVLAAALNRASQEGCPPHLARALRYAVFPGGARVRPRLCLAVAAACGDEAPGLSIAMAAALELLHCASLVHDDLPCMDDAPLRRGRASVHRAFGETTAVLVGDGLIALAFACVAEATAPQHASRAIRLSGLLARAMGTPSGLVAGQAWELEATVELNRYHRAKTAALFEAATVGGALAAARDDPEWALLGQALGEAYQIADDLADQLGDSAALGKLAGRDEDKSRPNAVKTLDVSGARSLLHAHLERAAATGRALGMHHIEGWLRTELGPMMAMARAS